MQGWWKPGRRRNSSCLLGRSLAHDRIEGTVVFRSFFTQDAAILALRCWWGSAANCNTTSTALWFRFRLPAHASPRSRSDYYNEEGPTAAALPCNCARDSALWTWHACIRSSHARPICVLDDKGKPWKRRRAHYAGMGPCRAKSHLFCRHQRAAHHEPRLRVLGAADMRAYFAFAATKLGSRGPRWR